MTGDSQLYIILFVAVIVICIIIWSKNSGSIDGVQLKPKLWNRDMCYNSVGRAYQTCTDKCNDSSCEDMCHYVEANAWNKCENVPR